MKTQIQTANHPAIKMILFALFSCLFLSTNVYSQEITASVICSGGETYTAQSYSLDFVVGEICIESYNKQTDMLTQGFLQGNLGPTAIEEVTDHSIVSLFPNPAIEHLTISISNQSTVVQYQLFSIRGEPLTSALSLEDRSTVDVRFLESGIYFLKLYFEDKKQLTKTFIKY